MLHPAAQARAAGASCESPAGALAAAQAASVAISALLSHERVLAVRLPGKRYDCGSKLGYLQASVELGLRHPEIGKEFGRYLKER